jgi:hypothetical protein
MTAPLEVSVYISYVKRVHTTSAHRRRLLERTESYTNT